MTWEGEIVTEHSVQSGSPPSAPLFRYIGQSDGVSTAAYKIDTGDPSTATPPLAEAIGRLLPMVDGKAVSATQANCGTFWAHPPSTGKVLFGIARDIDAILVLVQRNGAGGYNLSDFAKLVADAGVDQAVMGDGSDSATLVVDGVVEVMPGAYLKNRAIPDGLMFVPNSLSMASGATVTNDQMSTDPAFLTSFNASGLAGTISISTTALELSLDSLGTRSDTGADLASALGLSPPVILSAANAQLLPTVAMSFSNVDFKGEWTPTGANGGTMTGQLTIATSGGTVVLQSNWPLDIS